PSSLSTLTSCSNSSFKPTNSNHQVQQQFQHQSLITFHVNIMLKFLIQTNQFQSSSPTTIPTSIPSLTNSNPHHISQSNQARILTKQF
ncbi:hypothetical protein LINPERHAP1_LOCUS22697, partial [Linum perenne]